MEEDGLCQASERMIMRCSYFFILISACGFLWQCTETKEVNPEDLGTRYFPLKTGLYNIYQVGGTQYNSSVDSTTFSYFLRESVIDSFQNLASGISYTIQRDKKLKELDAWVLDSIWTSRKDEFTAVLIENNVAKVKLSFPVFDNKTWDGNNLNGYIEDEYEMVEVGSPYVGMYTTFDNTITVILEELPDRIVKNISQKEVYSVDKGLVYKENIILNYKQGDDLGLGIVETGIRYFQHLIDYGEE